MKHQSREQILKINQIFTTHLIQIQKAKHNPEDYAYQVGDQLLMEGSDKPLILSQEKAEELNKEEQDFVDSYRDRNPFKQVSVAKWVGGCTLISSKTNAEKYLSDLSNSLEGLRNQLKAQNLIVIGDWPTPWLAQENEYAPVKEAMDFLKMIISSDFDGGFLLNAKDLTSFIPRLFWLTRCNASLPDFLMTFENSKTIFSICKYGILHIESYDQEELKTINHYFKIKNFIEVDECIDPVDFDDFVGRMIKIN